MIPICYICLRDDRKLRSLDEDLRKFYNDLCDISNGIDLMFCAGCLYRLRKCYDFKLTCNLALEKYIKWSMENKRTRKPVNLLYQEAPASKLAYADKKNFKVFFYQEPDVDTPKTDNITTPQSDKDQIKKVDNIKETVVKKEDEDMELGDEMHEEYLEDSEENTDMPLEEWLEIGTDEETNTDVIDKKIDDNFRKLKVNPKDGNAANKFEIDSDDEFNDSNFDDELNDSNIDDKFNADSNFDGELNATTAVQPAGLKLGISVNVDDLKRRIRMKLKGMEAVKDEKGNVIDIDAVLNNLDKLTEKKLNRIRKLCAGSGPLKEEVVRKLVEIHSLYVEFESMFDIIHLSDRAQVEAEFQKRREYPSYVKYEHRCESCIKGFRFKKMLDHHMKMYHDDTAPFECWICHMRYKSRLATLRHIATSHTMVYKCKLCTDFVANDRTTMLGHRRRHTGEQYMCKYCGVYIKEKSALYAHYNKKHPSRNVCELCACAFSGHVGLNRHKQLKHRGEEFVQSELNKKCDECDVTFINDDVYKKHRRNFHKDVKRSQRIKNDYKRNAEKIINKNYPCPVCNWQAKTPWLRVQHLKTEHPKEYQEQMYNNKKYLCHDCGKGFSIKTCYEYHMNTHTGARPFACNKCPKRFHSQPNLIDHMQWHMPPSHECGQCGKKFATNTALAVHMRIHTGDRRFKCYLCDKSFLHSGSLKEHISGVHFFVRRKKKAKLAEE